MNDILYFDGYAEVRDAVTGEIVFSTVLESDVASIVKREEMEEIVVTTVCDFWNKHKNLPSVDNWLLNCPDCTQDERETIIESIAANFFIDKVTQQTQLYALNFQQVSTIQRQANILSHMDTNEDKKEGKILSSVISNKTEVQFPNGFNSYIQTYHDFSYRMLVGKNAYSHNSYELLAKWASEFEEENKGRDWHDGAYDDEIELFFEGKYKEYENTI